MKTPQLSQKGFSLIELLIVVAIIGIIAAIAIPNYLMSQQAARQASAIQSLRVIHSSEVSYRAINAGYTDLATLNTQGYIRDSELAAGQKSYYRFTVTLAASPSQSYEAIAVPVTTPSPWVFYFIDSTGVIRSEIGVTPTAASPALK